MWSNARRYNRIPFCNRLYLFSKPRSTFLNSSSDALLHTLEVSSSRRILSTNDNHRISFSYCFYLTSWFWQSLQSALNYAQSLSESLKLEPRHISSIDSRILLSTFSQCVYRFSSPDYTFNDLVSALSINKGYSKFSVKAPIAILTPSPIPLQSEASRRHAPRLKRSLLRTVYFSLFLSVLDIPYQHFCVSYSLLLIQ